jgi:hypothetical protein
LAYITIPGLTGKERIEASIRSIESQPSQVNTERLYYGILIDNPNREMKLYEGMEIQIDIKIGERTLMQYLLGRLYDVTQ